MAGVSKRQGCSGQVKVERLFAGPSVMVSGEQSWPISELQIGSVEGARDFSPVEL